MTFKLLHRENLSETQGQKIFLMYKRHTPNCAVHCNQDIEKEINGIVFLFIICLLVTMSSSTASLVSYIL